MLTVNLPSGDKLEFSTPVQVKDVALKIGPGLAKATVAAFVDDIAVYGVQVKLMKANVHPDYAA